jgi:hypothetical protein
MELGHLPYKKGIAGHKFDVDQLVDYRPKDTSEQSTPRGADSRNMKESLV